MTQIFDPAQFLDMTTEQEATRRPPLPPGDYTAMIGEVTVVQWAKGDKSGYRMSVPLSLQLSPELKTQLGLSTDSLKLTDSVFLDVTDNGGLDWSPGKNGGLRRYREATGMNKAGEPFSPRRLIGQPVKVKVTHDMYEGEIQERVGGVAKA